MNRKQETQCLTESYCLSSSPFLTPQPHVLQHAATLQEDVFAFVPLLIFTARLLPELEIRIFMLIAGC